MGTPTAVITVGVLSDTHGELHRRVTQALTGVDHVIHAGDVGSARVLAELEKLAPVTAVRGNCDVGAWAAGLPMRAELELGGARILVCHVVRGLHAQAGGSTPEGGRGFAVVIGGHTHIAVLQREGEALYLNPGSAGPRRFGRPRTIARLTIEPGLTAGPASRLDAEIIVVEA